MEKGFILSLIFAAIVAIFALNNSATVPINLLFVEVELSQAIVILISALLGAVIAFMFSWVRRLKLNREIKSLNTEIEVLKAENQNLKSSVESKDNQIKNLSKEIVNSPNKGVSDEKIMVNLNAQESLDDTQSEKSRYLEENYNINGDK